jgi:thiamine-monophosphate kinase
MSDPQSEADLIQSLFAPLSLGHSGSYGLQDDVAFLAPSQSGLIVTQDQIIEHTHFLPKDPLNMIARRLVRRNLSDMIAKGGMPIAAFLSLAWPRSRDRAGMAEFARGLGEDLAQLCGNCPLMGGDTSETHGHLVASLTMMGTPTAASGQPVLRSGAQVGDVVAVTGVIGDSWLGLSVRQGLLNRWGLEACREFSLAPCPPDLAVSELIGKYAHASIDVSDGLILDAWRIAAASRLAISMELDHIPLSEEAADFDDFDGDEERAVLLAIGGDDYQPLFTLTQSDFDRVQDAMKKTGVRLTKVGVCKEGQGVDLTFDGRVVAMPATIGWQI